jgi:phosphohistidine phosphatase SixA
MKIYIFRHAQKEFSFSNDPELSAEGHSQASQLLTQILNKSLPAPTQLWASPKKRTHSTLSPLSKHLGLSIKTSNALNEHQSRESTQDFHRRIEEVLHSVTTPAKPDSPDQIIFMCSHYDWLLEAMNLIESNIDLSQSKFADWEPCQYVGFEVDKDGIFNFLELSKITKDI